MWIFALLLLPLSIHCVVRNSIALNESDDSADSNQANCGHNYQSNCLIVATFGNLLSNESIDVLVNCTNDITLKYNQFSKIEKIVWNGCHAVRNLKYFGLRKIASRKNVRSLRVEKFFAESIQAGTFDGFSQLEELFIESNFIQSTTSSSFRGLDNLTLLQLINNNLLSIALETFQNLSKLSSLQIIEEHLLMANHQFSTNQIIENVTLEIYYVEMDLLEHLFHHVQNLSVSLKDDRVHGCEQSRFNGYEKQWLIQTLRLENFRCGFVIKNVDSLRTMKLSRMIMAPYDADEEFKLQNLKYLHTLHLNHNDIKDLLSVLDGDFSSLEMLDVAFNMLSVINISMFDSFPMLKHINFSHNPIVELINVEELKFEILFDSSSLDCNFLQEFAEKDYFKWLNYTKKFEKLNIKGLECSISSMPSVFAPLRTGHENISDSIILNNLEMEKTHAENFIVKRQNLAFIVCGSILLGSALTYIFIYAYNRSRLLKHQPFYHMLRDSLVRPFSNARDTLARDFKGIIFRNLPATNYEHPISTTTEMTEVIEGGNIYEEIPELMSR